MSARDNGMSFRGSTIRILTRLVDAMLAKINEAQLELQVAQAALAAAENQEKNIIDMGKDKPKVR